MIVIITGCSCPCIAVPPAWLWEWDVKDEKKWSCEWPLNVYWNFGLAALGRGEKFNTYLGRHSHAGRHSHTDPVKTSGIEFEHCKDNPKKNCNGNCNGRRNKNNCCAAAAVAR